MAGYFTHGYVGSLFVEKAISHFGRLPLAEVEHSSIVPYGSDNSRSVCLYPSRFVRLALAGFGSRAAAVLYAVPQVRAKEACLSPVPDLVIVYIGLYLAGQCVVAGPCVRSWLDPIGRVVWR